MTQESRLLGQLAQQKHDCLTQLLDLGQRQPEMIARGDMAGLLNVLASKQRLLGELHAVQQRMIPLTQTAPEARHWDNETSRQACAAILQHCDEMLCQILEAEKSSEDSLRRHRDDLAHKLKASHCAGQARAGYTSQVSLHGQRLDLQTG